MDFSIIIPAKNEEANIGRCLDSLGSIERDGITLEILVIDNSSSDGTRTVAGEKGVPVFEKPGLTISALRNFGARVAGGDVLVFLDADCSVHQTWLREASRYLCRNDVACFGSPPLVPDNSTWVQRSWFQVREKKHSVGDADWLESMNMFVRRDAFFAVGGFNEALATCEDYDLSQRLKQEGSIVADSRIIAFHHGEAATIRQFFRKELWRGTGNLAGLKSHAFLWKELPGVVFPLIHSAFALLVTGLVFAGLSGSGRPSGAALLFLVPLWQVPIFLLAVSKQRTAFRLIGAVQLHILLNIYFLARGGAVVPHFQRQ